MAANLRDVLIRPLVTEKTSVMMQDNKYTFEVPMKRQQDGNPSGCRKDLERQGPGCHDRQGPRQSQTPRQHADQDVRV